MIDKNKFKLVATAIDYISDNVSLEAITEEIISRANASFINLKYKNYDFFDEPEVLDLALNHEHLKNHNPIKK